MSRTVRTTMQPDRDIEVDDAEYLDLQRMGLLVDDDGTEPEPPATAAPPLPVNPAKKPTAGPAGSKEN
ncbi:hypothetical protein [Streptomyces sp. LUP30]|uniref:hypothetical protein n=1 Tax=Streptomyces sp. LUP30 TaxID=1890285 RepID=UPI00114C91F1|nr:hypothetical protein [Streptomyces sp. LUP30]